MKLAQENTRMYLYNIGVHYKNKHFKLKIVTTHGFTVKVKKTFPLSVNSLLWTRESTRASQESNMHLNAAFPGEKCLIVTTLLMLLKNKNNNKFS